MANRTRKSSIEQAHENGETPHAILTLTEVAERLQVHPITVHRLIRRLGLPWFRIGRSLRFDAAALEDWIRVTGISYPSGKHRRVRNKSNHN